MKRKTKTNISPKECPNCGHKSLHLVGKEWVCTECEYHTHEKKPARGSFR